MDVSTPVFSFFLRTFQIVVLAIPNVCAVALIDSSFFLSLNRPRFSPTDRTLVFLVDPFQQHVQSLQPRTQNTSRFSELLIV